MSPIPADFGQGSATSGSNSQSVSDSLATIIEALRAQQANPVAPTPEVQIPFSELSVGQGLGGSLSSGIQGNRVSDEDRLLLQLLLTSGGIRNILLQTLMSQAGNEQRRRVRNGKELDFDSEETEES